MELAENVRNMGKKFQDRKFLVEHALDNGGTIDISERLATIAKINSTGPLLVALYTLISDLESIVRVHAIENDSEYLDAMRKLTPELNFN